MKNVFAILTSRIMETMNLKEEIIMSMDKLLREEIQDEFEGLSKMELGTDTYKVTVDGVTKLVDRVIEIDKINDDREERRKKQEAENALKAEEMKMDRRDRRIKHGLTALGIVVPTVATVWGTLVMLQYEKEGIVSSIIGRGFVNSLLPKK